MKTLYTERTTHQGIAFKVVTKNRGEVEKRFFFSLNFFFFAAVNDCACFACPGCNCFFLFCDVIEISYLRLLTANLRSDVVFVVNFK